MTELQSLVTQQCGTESKPAAQERTVSRALCTRRMTNIQEIVGTAYKAQSDTYAMVSKRVAENVEELKALAATRQVTCIASPLPPISLRRRNPRGDTDTNEY